MATVGAQGLIVGDSGLPGYVYTVAVPPGVAKMAPDVKIGHLPGAMGPLGYGWALQGLSVINRCNGTSDIDGATRTNFTFRPSDKLCLDGQRLLQTDALGTLSDFPQTDDSGGVASGFREFRTEKASASRIRAYGQHSANADDGPAYFKVWTKDGLIIELGNGRNVTANAAITLQGRTRVHSWLVSRISDTLGNYVDFQYEQRDVATGSATFASSSDTTSTVIPGREWSLVEIRYTGTATHGPVNKVVFQYVDRPLIGSAIEDRAEMFAGGTKQVSVRLLSSIVTYINSPNPASLGPAATALKVKTVLLAYEPGPVSRRSLLKSITECVGTTNESCQPPVSFTYTPGTDVGESFTANTTFRSGPLSTLQLHSNNATFGTIPADFDGDGRTDLLRWSSTPSGNQLWRNVGGGNFVQDTAFNITGDALFSPDGCAASLLTDINGDSLYDILRYGECGDATPTLVFMNLGGGRFERRAYSGPSLRRITSLRSPNGTCVFIARRPVPLEPAPGRPNWTCYVSEGATFYLLDFDRDGKTDIVTTRLPAFRVTYVAGADADRCLTSVCTQVWKGNGMGTFTELPTNLAKLSLYSDPKTGGLGMPANVQDIDRDGAFDIKSVNTQNYNKTSTFRSLGDGNFESSWGATGCDALSEYSGGALDFNGDGVSDCLSLRSGTSVTLTAGPAAAVLPIFVTNFNLNQAGLLAGTGTGTITLDVNGDGRDDVVRWRDDPTQNTIFLSKGDGTFLESTTFNLKTPEAALRKSDSSVVTLAGDFSGSGQVELLRLVHGPSASGEATRNQLYSRPKTLPPDMLLSARTQLGMSTTLSYIALTAPVASDGTVRYQSDRGTANQAEYPSFDMTPHAFVVADSTSTTPTAESMESIVTRYAYAGWKAAFDGRGGRGFREVRREGRAADGRILTLTTRFVQHEPYLGVKAFTESRLSALNESGGTILSRARNTYCDGTVTTATRDAVIASVGNQMSADIHCTVPATTKIKSPYLLATRTESADLGGSSLPAVEIRNTFDGGNPVEITVTSEGVGPAGAESSTKTTTNQYWPDLISGDSWRVGRLKSVVQRNAVPNTFAALAASSGTAPLATAHTGDAGTAPTRAVDPAVLSVILQLLLED